MNSLSISLKYALVSFTILCLSVVSAAQVVSVDPAFPTVSSSLTITFDASKGNQGLRGYTGDVYAHTGLITDKSVSNSDWKYVQGTWGTANAPQLISLGNDMYELNISDVVSIYGVPATDTIKKIAILFRSEDGSKSGRAADGSDIFIDFYTAGLFAGIESPTFNSIFTMGQNIEIKGAASEISNLSIHLNGSLMKTEVGQSINYTLNNASAGNYEVVVGASIQGETVTDTSHFVVSPSVTLESLPMGNKLGINYTSSTSILLALYSPYKQSVYVVGDFNDWRVDTNYFLKKDNATNTWWLQIEGLEAGKKYAFQYLVDGALRIADPYSELVLDPNNDPWIDAATYPNPHPYPTGKTSGIATLIEMNQASFDWEVEDFVAPAENDLIVYELLVRDFVKAHNYATLLDTLDYLENLGINAIELMPINEFEGNESWGYNPSFHMALDKYYGTPQSFKRFVDACHKRGIAVILDVVYNHAFSQSPLCQLYWDATNFRPSGLSPYANITAKHDFNVGYDLNHESSAIQNYVKQVMEYWLQAYKVDGFRFDLSKGFTQKNTLGDVGAWGQYDGARVNTIKRIYSEVKAVNPNAYVILEHFAENREEKELADFGCMFWGNLNHEAAEAAMGYSSNFSGAHYSARGWNSPKLIAYAESHDEERIMYKNLQYGNVNGSYTVKDINTALDRVELTWVVFGSIPGPKMMWQFQELGYEIPIDQNGRTGNKPILWNYNKESPRKDVYEVFSEINKLKSTYEAFKGDDFSMDVAGSAKRVHLNNANKNFVVLGNFGVTEADVVLGFQHTGMWYEYFSGDSLEVTDTEMKLTMQAGEYAVWTDKPIKSTFSIGAVNEQSIDNLALYPNPTNNKIYIAHQTGIQAIKLMDATGKEVMTAEGEGKIENALDLSEFAPGVYYLQVKTQAGSWVNTKVVKL